MARKSPNDTAKEKAAKQKKTVIVLGVVPNLLVQYAPVSTLVASR